MSMNLVLDLKEMTIQNIYFYESVKNTVMNDSSFIRLIYSNKTFTLNGIYIKIIINKEFNLTNIVEPYTNSTNLQLITTIQHLENNILNKYNSKKIQNNKLKDQLLYLINKLTNIPSNKINATYILKISGIWETHSLIGLTFKFIYLNEI
jgi:hypothetical protein